MDIVLCPYCFIPRVGIELARACVAKHEEARLLATEQKEVANKESLTWVI